MVYIFTTWVFRSKGEAKAMFLRHEGFLGALGAFMNYQKQSLDDLAAYQLVEQLPKSGSNEEDNLIENGSIELSLQLSR